MSPVQGARLSSPFGERWGRLHAGLDYATPVGTPLRAMSKGTVAFAGQQGAYGTKVEIRYWDGTVSYYGHMSKTLVTMGQQVAKGQVVGLSGNTGRSTGPHLHLEIHPRGHGAIDPQPWLIVNGVMGGDTRAATKALRQSIVASDVRMGVMTVKQARAKSVTNPSTDQKAPRRDRPSRPSH